MRVHPSRSLGVGYGLGLIGALVLGPLSIAAVLTLGPDPIELRAGQPLTHRQDGYLGAAACVVCHPAQHASWRRTWHASMNQWATPATVAGAFDGRTVSFYGQQARVFQLGEGAGASFHMELPTAAGGRRQADVAMTVGSHVYQQYFEWRAAARAAGGASGGVGGVGGGGLGGDVDHGQRVLTRLPLLWHIEERRWLHINGVFLSPDQPSWTDRPAIWNENCIFCHTTGPRPGMLNFAAAPRPDAKRFDSKTADLGISCEACHGPGAAHAAAMRNPVARYRSYLMGSGPADGAGATDLKIIHPHKLDKERAVSACGQCHGQRLPKPLTRIQELIEQGPRFRVGDLLVDHVSPIGPHTSLDGRSFAARFWADGTPRLTAYEYQGVVASPCYQRGEMTCESCHTMHGFDAMGADRRGFLDVGMRGDRACLQCHQDIAADLAAHTRHRPDSSGSRCMACHMPEIVYGVLGIHRSHRIENPDPARAAAAGRPDACTLCHLGESPQWAGTQMRHLFGDRYQVPTQRANGVSIELPDALASLLAGDAIQRAVYAHALGRADSAPGDQVDGTIALIATLGDAYASVRTMAWRSLTARAARLNLELGDRFTALDPAAIGPAERRVVVREMLAELPRRARSLLAVPTGAGPRRHLLRAGAGQAAPEVDLELLVRLLNIQSHKVIDIGE